MEPTSNQPQEQTPTQPGSETIFTEDPTPPPKKSKKRVVLLSLLALLLLASIAGATFLILKKDKKEPVAQVSTTQTEQTQQGSSATKTLSVNYPKTAAFDGNDELGGLFTIEAPSSWQTYKGEEIKVEGYDADFKSVEYYIGDPDGKYHLQIRFGLDGLGGACDGGENESYTLTKKLPTKIDGYFWTEYNTEKGLKLEHYLTNSTDPAYIKHTKLSVGETNKDTCNLFSYPSIPTQDGQPAAFLQIVAGSAKNKGENLPNSDMNDRVSYEELNSETGFIEAIQTVNYTK